MFLANYRSGFLFPIEIKYVATPTSFDLVANDELKYTDACRLDNVQEFCGNVDAQNTVKST